MKLRTLPLLVALSIASACGKPREQAEAPATPPPAPATDSTGAMQGMRGMPMDAMPGGQMMAEMRSHLRAMHNADGDSLRRMLPRHRELTASMMAEMNREMRQMNMPADPAWTATADSVQQDLVRMPDMGSMELKAFMPGHQVRIDRLLQMHQTMMSGHRG